MTPRRSDESNAMNTGDAETVSKTIDETEGGNR